MTERIRIVIVEDHTIVREGLRLILETGEGFELIGEATDWTELDGFLLAYAVEPSMRASVFASSLAATLELAREGVLDLHQTAAFSPIHVRKRLARPDGDAPVAG